MGLPPPGTTPGPFGPGGRGFPPPGFGGPIVVHRARFLPRLVLVVAIMAVSTAVTGAVIWFAVLGTADHVDLGSRGGSTRATGAGADDGVSLPPGWPEALAPPEGARIVTSVANGTGADEQLVLVVEATGGGAAVADALRAQLADAGLTVTTDAATAGVGSISATGAGWEATVALSPNPARAEVTTVSWVLRRGLR